MVGFDNADPHLFVFWVHIFVHVFRAFQGHYINHRTELSGLTESTATAQGIQGAHVFELSICKHDQAVTCLHRAQTSKRWNFMTFATFATGEKFCDWGRHRGCFCWGPCRSWRSRFQIPQVRMTIVAALFDSPTFILQSKAKHRRS